MVGQAVDLFVRTLERALVERRKRVVAVLVVVLAEEGTGQLLLS